jgi:hypothetical protein
MGDWLDCSARCISGRIRLDDGVQDGFLRIFTPLRDVRSTLLYASLDVGKLQEGVKGDEVLGCST